MIFALAIANFQLRPSEYVIGRCAEAHKALSRASVTVKVATIGAEKTENLTYRLAYNRGTAARLEVVRTAPLTVVVEPKRIVQFDGKTGQYTIGKRQQGSLAEEIKATGATSDEVIANLLDPEGIPRMLRDLNKKGLWMLEARPSGITAACLMPDGRMEVTADPQTHLLRHIAMKMQKYGTDYWFSYGQPPASIQFSPPTGAYQTTELRPQITRPKPTTRQESRLVAKIFDRYDNPGRLAYSLTANNEDFKVWIDHGAIKQTDGSVTWAYEQGFLTLVDARSRTFVSGPAKLSDMIEVVAKCGSRAETLLRMMLRGINPFRFYFSQSPDLVVSGSTAIEGNQSTIMEAKGKSSTYSLIVRDSDGFVYSIMPLVAGKPGSDLPSSPRTYKPLAQPPGSFKLDAPAGYQRKTVADLVGQPPP
ncbi:MAG: hypothetical protein JSS66_15720 [Armatimonadetes bacterium]|nr:hypothetical protein [Armatimonadota bacterium]